MGGDRGNKHLVNGALVEDVETVPDRMAGMKRAYYSRNVADCLTDDPDMILGQLARQSEFGVEQSQRDAWLEQIEGLKQVLNGRSGSVYFEYAIPRMGKRADVRHQPNHHR